MMRPIKIIAATRMEGPRIGGAAPLGLESEFQDEWTQYFGTFPLTDGREFSVFHRFEVFGEDDERDVILHNNQVLRPSKLIWVVVHDHSVRAQSSPNTFPPHAVVIGESSEDRLPDPNANVGESYSGSKMFGSCYVERHVLSDAVTNLESEGAIHLLQIGMDRDTLIDGFPWDPGYLNVWAFDVGDSDMYRFCIQQ